MKIKKAAIFALILIIGICSGWLANSYWEKETRRMQSTMALVSANEAAQNGDLNKAIKYAMYALVLDTESPMADLQLKEYTKRADKISASKCKNESILKPKQLRSD